MNYSNIIKLILIDHIKYILESHINFHNILQLFFAVNV